MYKRRVTAKVAGVGRVIAAAGPFADPFPAGCGWGPACGLPAFDAVDGVLGMAGLTAQANEITVYPCGAFVCVDTNTATLSGMGC